MENTLILIPLLPLAGAALCGLVHASRLPRGLAGLAANLAVWAAFLLALLHVLELPAGAVVTEQWFTWIDTAWLTVGFVLFTAAAFTDLDAALAD